MASRENVYQPSAIESDLFSSSGDVSNPSTGDILGNMFSGNLDFQRSLYMQDRVNDFNALEAEKARKHSSEEARIAREWQEMMSNTAYSRAVKDLESVGINPYALGSFNSASTPSGAVGSSFSASGRLSGTAGASGSITSIANTAIRALSMIYLKKG